MTLGDALRAARERAGLGTDELAQLINLRPRVIAKMEENDFAPCGGDTYARLHLRNIARVTGVAENEFISLFDSSHSTSSRSIHEQLVDNNAASIKKENRKVSWKALVALSLTVVVAIGAVQFVMDSADSELAPVSPMTTPSPTPTPTVVPTAVASENPTVIDSNATGALTLVIAAVRGDSSINVVAGGVDLFKGRLMLGEEKTFTAAGRISIYLSNAGDLDLTLNGAKLAPLGLPNQEIRKTFTAN